MRHVSIESTIDVAMPRNDLAAKPTNTVSDNDDAPHLRGLPVWCYEVRCADAGIRRKGGRTP